jgi:hypothetical protein
LAALRGEPPVAERVVVVPVATPAAAPPLTRSHAEPRLAETVGEPPIDPETTVAAAPVLRPAVAPATPPAATAAPAAASGAAVATGRADGAPRPLVPAGPTAAVASTPTPTAAAAAGPSAQPRPSAEAAPAPASASTAPRTAGPDAPTTVAAAPAGATPTAAVAPVPTVRVVEGGGFGVQIASLTSPDAAERQWQALRTAHGALLGGLEPVTMTAEVDGIRRWRLRVGPFDRRGAEALCRGLQARGADCYAVAF